MPLVWGNSHHHLGKPTKKKGLTVLAFQILKQSISKYNLALSEAGGLGDTGNEFPFGPDSLQVHDCTSHVRGNKAFIPQVKSQLEPAGGQQVLTVILTAVVSALQRGNSLTTKMSFSDLVEEQDLTSQMVQLRK